MTDAKPSKSARKREFLALQELGEKLLTLKDDELDSIPLDEELRRAVRDAGRMKSRGALRRQKQLIGKLMRRADAEPIRAALHRLGAGERQAKRVFAAAERWRDRVVSEGEAAIDAFENETGGRDTELRGILGELQRTLDYRGERTLRRRLFRHIHASLVTTVEANHRRRRRGQVAGDESG